MPLLLVSKRTGDLVLGGVISLFVAFSHVFHSFEDDWFKNVISFYLIYLLSFSISYGSHNLIRLL